MANGPGSRLGIVLIGSIVVGALLILLLRDAYRIMTGRPVRPKPKPAPNPDLADTQGAQKTGYTFYLGLIVTVAVITYLITPRAKGVAQVPATPIWLRLLYVVGGIVFLLVLTYLVLWVRVLIKLDRVSMKAVKRADEGDIAGAIQEMLEAIEHRPPSAVRTNNLGTLYDRLDQHQESLKCFLESESLGGRQPVFVYNQACVLRKLGRPDEALLLLEEVLSRDPNEAVFIATYAQTLADLGRHEQAREQIRRIDTLQKVWVWTFPRKFAEARAKFLKEARDHVASLSGEEDVDSVH